MRWNGCPITIALAAALTLAAAPASAAGFGTVIPIAGHVSDIALDETRGALYIANFTANRIEVMSTSDYKVRSSINVAAQPGSIALSPDGQYLVVAHYGNWAESDPMKNLVTVINLATNARQTFVTGDPALGVTFLVADGLRSGLAILVTSRGLVEFDPASGVMRSVGAFVDLASKVLPQPAATVPPVIMQTAVATSGDGYTVWGVGDAGTGTQVVFSYGPGHAGPMVLAASSIPPLLPRVSVNRNGSRAMIGYAMFGNDFRSGVIKAQYPDATASANVTGSAFDSDAGIVYAQIPHAASYPAPVLEVLEADNLTVREALTMPADIAGRSVLSSGGKALYAVTGSGVMALPVGSRNQYPRVAASQEDVLIHANYCDRRVLTKDLVITDPGGGATEFTITVNQPGVSVSPSSGVTPMKVQIRVDPNAFQSQTGTTAVPLQISSSTAINIAPPVRLLVNNPGPDQRGTVINVPGRLSDMLADPQRGLIYILRQDKNQLLVYDGSDYGLLHSFRLGATPSHMTFSSDRRRLVVGHENSQLLHVFDLDSMRQLDPIPLPFGKYVRWLAESNVATLAVSRNGAAAGPTGATSAWVGEESGQASVDRLDIYSGLISSYSTLGIWDNLVSDDAALASAPNGSSILLAEPNGNVKLYSASANTFILSRKDFPSLEGAIAASNYETYVVGNHFLNKSLFPEAVLDSSAGGSTGFAFVSQGGFRTTGSSSSGPGAIQNITSFEGVSAVKPTRIIEAPLMPRTGMVFTRTVSPLATGSTVVSLSTSGFTVLSWNYDAAVAPPTISAVTNAADGSAPVAPGGLITVWGQHMSPVSMATKEMPLPSALGESCVIVNGVPAPLLFVSSQQINAQLPFNVSGNAVLSIRTPGGASDNQYVTILPAAPSIFRSGSAGPDSGIATVVRWQNGELVTPANPVHREDTLIFYLTGMGRTTPEVESGLPGPVSPLAYAEIQPEVTLGGRPLNVFYAGLAPGLVGVNQINATVPFDVPTGLSIPLVITQAGVSTELSVRVVR